MLDESPATKSSAVRHPPTNKNKLLCIIFILSAITVIQSALLIKHFYVGLTTNSHDKPMVLVNGTAKKGPGRSSSLVQKIDKKDAKNSLRANNEAAPLKFVHIPGTGGTTIEIVAIKAGIAWGQCMFQTTKNACNPLKQSKHDDQSHKTFTCLRRDQIDPWHCPPAEIPQTYRNSNTFAVVRNPYDRLISIHHSMLSEDDTPNNALVTDRQYFNEWVEATLGEVKLYGSDIVGHAIPMHKYTHKNDGKQSIDHVLKFESLSEEFPALMKKYDLGLTLKQDYKMTQQSKQSMSIADLTPENLELVNDWAKLDLEYFGYKMIRNTNASSKPVPEKRKTHIIAVADKAFQVRYAPIFNAMSQYASHHGYDWHIIGEPGTEPFCEEKYTNGFFFRKHCIIAKWMDRETNIGEKIYVLDSDVVPYRKDVPLFHWTYLKEDLVLYERTWNPEIAAGNYIVRNTKATQAFLMRWADYEFEIPPGYSSADNGAIHLHVIREMGMELFENGECGKMYYNLTAPVTNLDPYFAFVDCTRKHSKPGSYQSEDSSLSIRILAKDTGWVMDGVYDGYGREGFGPGGIGPVFHHGAKMHGDKTDLRVIDKYELDSNHSTATYSLAESCNPVIKAAGCTEEGNSLGAVATPGECAKEARRMRSCGDYIQFSTSYPEWGCRCCDVDDTPNQHGDKLWDLYSASACTVED